ncbi:PTS system mannose/fructose/sorbose family transporter subunit IID [Weissella viridescens]|uniref:PTS system mannose/fructose/sorbose family transporter subunit IID n=1 Tax=Weissella viridescens TaxID=1629 RepID=UPI001D07880B|nr:PTS system mannose/fructose/sorbose family transporter subunit IID [Weissella viridescens]MCB6840946.1 PTS system mannose/fructose/sorbose family transporter subunit IID [Weissella viridescens]MCB6847666.1 PTS system mannose/fructose/sorbose family transporter subunit IID [Weissella viridescens]
MSNSVQEKQVQMNEVHLTKGDRYATWWRSTFLQAAWNYERMQNVGWAYAMVPTIKRLYKTKEDRAAALKRHLEFFNTHPYVASPILGVEMAMEEQKANGVDIDDEAINSVKVGMMGPLAGVGDPIWWGTVRPVLGAFAAGLAQSGQILGPIIFFVVWNIMRMAFLWYTQELGYREGTNITQNLGGGMMQKLTTGASILGMFIMGVLVPRWTTMNFPMVLSKVNLQKGSYVDTDALAKQINTGHLSPQTITDIAGKIKGGQNLGAVKITTVQDTLNQLIPGLAPLLLMFVVLWLLRKHVSPIVIIFGLFAVGILAYALGIMA